MSPALCKWITLAVFREHTCWKMDVINMFRETQILLLPFFTKTISMLLQSAENEFLLLSSISIISLSSTGPRMIEFKCFGSQSSPILFCSEGVFFISLARLEETYFVLFDLYSLYWDKSTDKGNHILESNKYQKNDYAVI